MSRPRCPTVPVFVAALALAGCAGLSAPPPPAAITVSDQSEAAAPAIAALRAESGLGPVRPDAALARAALDHARGLGQTRVLSHDGGGGLRGRLTAVGVRDVAAAENLGQGQPSLERVLASWRRSPEHAANLALPEARRFGLARADGPGGPWWVLVLAGEPSPGAVWR